MTNDTPIPSGHFFGANNEQWKTSTNIKELLRFFDKQKLSFQIAYVDLPIDSGYGIKDFLPDLKDVIIIHREIVQ